jgi:hypothetical protein
MDVAVLGKTTIIGKTRESMRLLIILFKSHSSFWGFTKIIENKFRGIPVLKQDGLTLITESEKTNAMASKFSLA